MPSTTRTGGRDHWFLLAIVFFAVNILVCYHIDTEEQFDATGAKIEMLSLFSEKSSGKDLPVFAICLLTRDDLPILPEWIAYHYHAVNLRHLVVAVDPLSASDPEPILENFRRHLNKTKDPLVIEEWREADFMPDYFVRGEYGKAPHFVGGGKDPDNLTWEEWYSSQENFHSKKLRDQTLVNSHRYRQTRFLSRCSEHLQQTYGNVWMSTLDSDEYMVANPWRMQEDFSLDPSILRLEKGAVLRWLIHAQEQTKTHGACIPIPRLLFGAIELSSRTPEKLAGDHTHGFVRRNNTLKLVSDLPRHSNTMETLRWKFHAAANDERNFQQKVVLKLDEIPKHDELWGDRVHTVHRPSRSLCLPESNDNFRGALLLPNLNKTIEASPIMAFHYIGSEERYFSRPKDFRRSPKRYRQRSNITHARDETGWIDQWLERFVDGVGIETASALLSSYAVDEQDVKQ